MSPDACHGHNRVMLWCKDEIGHRGPFFTLFLSYQDSPEVLCLHTNSRDQRYVERKPSNRQPGTYGGAEDGARMQRGTATLGGAVISPVSNGAGTAYVAGTVTRSLAASWGQRLRLCERCLGELGSGREENGRGGERWGESGGRETEKRWLVGR